MAWMATDGCRNSLEKTRFRGFFVAFAALRLKGGTLSLACVVLNGSSNGDLSS